ncbi:MAG: ABC transporter ATP-binding protein [Eubacteriales bacterium]|nr:ABC transporter ATP-binding protein [Eubacteriales bacterium]
METHSAIQVDGLRVCYGKQVVLNDLSVAIPAGQIVGVLGPSGSGKTTLVKSIIGINRFEAGAISVFGKAVPSLPAMEGIGYMAQSDALYDDLTAADNLVFFGRIYGLGRAKAQAKAAELLDFVGLGAEGKKSVRFYSGGMRRRLSLAIALINHPRLLILDEPTVGIDPVLRQKFWAEFDALKAEGCTLLTTTHVMDEAARCDRLLLLRDGKILANGTVPELLSQAGAHTVEEAFLRFSGEVVKEAC